MKSKKIVMVLLLVIIMILAAVGCGTQADNVSANLSKEADSFNVVRQLTVINCIKGDVLFQMTGKMSITADTADNQLEITIEDENGNYQKHFVGLSDNVTYVVEQKMYKDVSNYHYTLNFNPAMWIPVDVKTID
jgi:outer membrane lipoprotein-sorting protein